jgi:hypothetical protein
VKAIERRKKGTEMTEIIKKQDTDFLASMAEPTVQEAKMNAAGGPGRPRQAD